MKFVRVFAPLAILTLVTLAIPTVVRAKRGEGGEGGATRVTVPLADRFTPFAITIHQGGKVQWVNTDTDNHAVVSDDAFDTSGHQGFNQILVGTDNNGGAPGTLSLKFPKAGTFVYYCRFHAHLDASNQPVAPGTDGGIQDSNNNFGTPMMGIVTVLPD